MLSANLSPVTGTSGSSGSSHPSCRPRHAPPLRPDLRTPTTSDDLRHESANMPAADLFYSPEAPMTGLASSLHDLALNDRSTYAYASSARTSALRNTLHPNLQSQSPPVARTLTPVDRFGTSHLPSQYASDATDSDERGIPSPAFVSHAHGYTDTAHHTVAQTLMAHHQHSPRRSAASSSSGGHTTHRSGSGYGGHGGRCPPTARRSNSRNGNGGATASATGADTRIKLTNDALTAMAAIADVVALGSGVDPETQRAMRKYSMQVLGTAQSPAAAADDAGAAGFMAMAVEASSNKEVYDGMMEASAGRMWDQSGANAYETDYGRDFD